MKLLGFDSLFLDLLFHLIFLFPLFCLTGLAMFLTSASVPLNISQIDHTYIAAVLRAAKFLLSSLERLTQLAHSHQVFKMLGTLYFQWLLEYR